MAQSEQTDHLRISDLRAVVQLATLSTVGVTEITERVHQSIWSTLGFAARAPGRTRGITGLVYRSIVRIARMTGRSAELALAGLENRLQRAVSTQPGSPQREAFLAALNGVMGDQLASHDNSFATQMQFYCNGTPLDCDSRPSIPNATGKVLLLIHGLCMNNQQWRCQHKQQTVDHGDALASGLASTPVYLRYNSGLHTSQNGQQLSEQLTRLLACWPVPVEELTIVAHSMGGLVARSACHSAEQANLAWLTKLNNIVFLGTPHHGAPLERLGGWVDTVLAATPYTAPFVKLTQLRSVGITDLRFGNVVATDWVEPADLANQDIDPDQAKQYQRDPFDRRQITPLPAGVACFAIAAIRSIRPGSVDRKIVGDGLVSVASALGQHRDARRHLGFPKDSTWIARGINHLALLSNPRVTRQILRWLSPAK